MRKDLPQGEATQAASSRLWEEGEDVERFFEDEDRKALFVAFPEKVEELAVKHGYEGSKGDMKALAGFLHQCNVRMGGALSRVTIKNWLTKSPPSARSREKVYQMCFALGLSADETEEFFIKAYWDRPFDMKVPHECVYWFCVKNGLPYHRAEELCDMIDREITAEPELMMESTAQIEAGLQEITGEEDLIQYMRRHPGSSAQRNVTAHEEVLRLLDECKMLAGDSFYTFADDDDRQGSKNKPLSDDRLLEVIYGFNQRKVHRQGEEWEFAFPAYIKRNFPQVSQLSQIRNWKASYDTIRKTLILLEFYAFYEDARLHHMDEDGRYGDVDDFETEIGGLLVRCGFGELYSRNPYDYMFLYCARQDRPLDSLQDCIAEYWSEK